MSDTALPAAPRHMERRRWRMIVRRAKKWACDAQELAAEDFRVREPVLAAMQYANARVDRDAYLALRAAAIQAGCRVRTLP